MLIFRELISLRDVFLISSYFFHGGEKGNEQCFFWPQANLVGRGTLFLNMCTAPHARKHAEGFAEGIISRKVCGSFVADMNLLFQFCMLGKARRSDDSRSRKVLLRTRSATLTRRAVANRCQQPPKKTKAAGGFRARFAEGSRKLRGRVAPCLPVARVSQWSPSLHRLWRNTTLLPFLK